MSVRGIKRKLDLGVQIVHVVWLTEAAMRDEAECDEDEDTPDGLWDDEGMRILLHKRLIKTPRYARQIYLHEIGHAALDLYHRVR